MRNDAKPRCTAIVRHAAIRDGRPTTLPGQCGNYAMDAHDKCHVHAAKHGEACPLSRNPFLTPRPGTTCPRCIELLEAR